jgi:hypothetical protein
MRFIKLFPLRQVIWYKIRARAREKTKKMTSCYYIKIFYRLLDEKIYVIIIKFCMIWDPLPARNENYSFKTV